MKNPTLLTCLWNMGRIWYFLPIFGLATSWLYFLTRMAPVVGHEDKEKLHFPTSLLELQQLAQLLHWYKSSHPSYVLLLFASAYIYKQAFTIPGSALLNILGGALFGMKAGFPLCCALTGIGASCCFCLSKYVGKNLVTAWFPDKVKYLQSKVDSNRHQLFYYLLCLRVFPMSPNWLITIVSPIIGIPYKFFLVTIVLGLMPYNFVCVQTGEMVASITSLDQVFTLSMVLKLSGLALVILGLSLFRKNPDVAASE